MIRYAFITAVLLWGVVGNLAGQSFSAKLRKISMEDGLSNRFVRRTFQDSKGFIWLGTNYGLNRYDGYDFRLFTKEEQDLPSNRIFQMYEDADTCMWVRFSNEDKTPSQEISIIDLKTLEVLSFTERFGENFPVKEYDVFEIYQVAPTVVFIVTKSRQVYEYHDGKQLTLLFTLPYPNYTLTNIMATDEAVWVVGMGYILEYDRKGVLQEEELVPFQSVLSIHKEGNHLAGFARYLQNDSLFYFSKKPHKTVEYGSPGFSAEKMQVLNPTSNIWQASNGVIWYHDFYRSCMYNSKGELIYDFVDHFDPSILQGIFHVFFDKNNNAWIGTTDGVYILTINSNRFYSYLDENEFLPGSEQHKVHGIVEHDNYLYANTKSGRKRINLLTEEVESLEEYAINGDYGRAPEEAAMKDSKGYIWFCGSQNNVQRYDPVNDTLINIPCKHAIPTDVMDYEDKNLTLYEDSHLRVWLGTQSGVYYFDTLHQAFIKFNAYSQCTQLNESAVFAILEDTASNMLWVGSTTGLYQYDYKLGHFTYHYSSALATPYYLPSDHIYSLHKEKERNILWLGTMEGGLVKWETSTGDYEHFTIAQELSDNTIYGILEDEHNQLWMSSNQGLMRFDKENDRCATYLPREGITTEQFTRSSFYKADDGRFYFGSDNGIVAFYPQHFQRENLSNTPFHILKYECLTDTDKEMQDRTEDLLRDGKIQLEPNDLFFRLSFALLDYRSPSQNTYQYKIDGSGQGWQNLSGNELRINRLAFGNYRLVIKGKGADGQWSKHKLTIPIEVLAPFYKTTLFGLLMAFLLIAFIMGIARIYVINNRRKKLYLEREIANRTQKLLEREQDLLKAKEEAEKSSHAKAEFLSIMSHEIRTPMNAVVNLTNFLLEDSPAVRQVENLNILKFSANNLLAIINDVLDFNKIESGKVEFEAIDFDLLHLLDSIRYSMAVNARKKNIGFLLESTINLSTMLVGDPNRLTQILNNLISNAIKFTDEGRVKLCLNLVEETSTHLKLGFAIQDTGIGISDEEKLYIFNMFTQAASDTTRKYGGTGLGLAITRRLLQLQDSKIELESTVGKGSTFSFVLEFGKGALLKKSHVAGVPAQNDKRDLTGKHILVVEDNTVNVLVVKRFLQKWGVEFVHAEDGLEALKKVANYSFDLILMDIHMPNMDGYEAAKAIRDQGDTHYEQVPIIALTASALMDNKERVFEAGMNDIVVKPFKPAELYRILTQYIN
ncbi:MAG: response regulator [Aureispira sp.]